MSSPSEVERAVVVAVGAMAEVFGRQATEATVRAYQMGLEGLTVEQVGQAAKRALQSSRFMPSPAELREFAGESPVSDRAVIAWDALQRARGRFGYWHSVCFDDPAINAAVRSLGGWERLPERFEQESEPFLRKEFERAYGTYARRGITRAEGATLIGRLDRMNADAGYVVEKPRMITTGLKPTRQIAGPGQQPNAVLTLDAATQQIGRVPL